MDYRDALVGSLAALVEDLLLYQFADTSVRTWMPSTLLYRMPLSDWVEAVDVRFGSEARIGLAVLRNEPQQRAIETLLNATHALPDGEQLRAEAHDMAYADAALKVWSVFPVTAKARNFEDFSMFFNPEALPV